MNVLGSDIILETYYTMGISMYFIMNVYIPAFYSEFMFNLIQNNGRYMARIESIHVEAFPQRKVNISVYGELLPSCQTQDLDMLHEISLEVI